MPGVWRGVEGGEWWGWVVKVEDDRGVARRVVGVWTDARFRQPWFRRWRRYGVWLTLLMIIVTLYRVVMMLWGGTGRGPSLGVLYAINVGMLSLLISQPIVWAFSGVASLVLTLVDMKEEEVWGNDRRQRGCCRACGHSLSGLTAEADGCDVCPECGAAWRVLREGGSGS